jgi:hypothetical protein
MPQYQQVVAHQGRLSAGLRLHPWGIAPFLIAPRAGALAVLVRSDFWISLADCPRCAADVSLPSRSRIGGETACS